MTTATGWSGGDWRPKLETGGVHLASWASGRTGRDAAEKYDAPALRGLQSAESHNSGVEKQATLHCRDISMTRSMPASGAS